MKKKWKENRLTGSRFVRTSQRTVTSPGEPRIYFHKIQKLPAPRTNCYRKWKQIICKLIDFRRSDTFRYRLLSIYIERTCGENLEWRRGATRGIGGRGGGGRRRRHRRELNEVFTLAFDQKNKVLRLDARTAIFSSTSSLLIKIKLIISLIWLLKGKLFSSSTLFSLQIFSPIFFFFFLIFSRALL